MPRFHQMLSTCNESTRRFCSLPEDWKLVPGHLGENSLAYGVRISVLLLRITRFG